MRAIANEHREAAAHAAPTSSRVEGHASAELRMRRGRSLVLAGFVVAVAGIVAYCVACLTAGREPALGSYLNEHAGVLVGPALGVIGAGTLLWLVGSFMYLRAAMDSGPDGDTLDL